MKDPRTFVIVGAGLAGAKAAQTLRDEGFDGDVVLLGEEPERPYERPPLSKGLLLGTADRETVFVHEAGWYAERINTDSALYGGSNLGNGGGIRAEPVSAHGRPFSVQLTLPPLATLILERHP